MLKNFENWLLEQNYKPSTKSDYFTKKRHFEINIIGLQN